MQLYEYTKDNRKILNSSIYVNLKYLSTVESFSLLFANTPIKTNIKDSERFIKELVDYEEENTNGKRKETRNCYGICLEFLLESKESSEDLGAVVDKVLERYELKEHPFYSYSYQIGNGNYLVIYICERIYYPFGHETVVKAKKDIYKSSVTGRACKKDDVGAYLHYRKGETISKRITSFSSKVRIFRYASTEQFTHFINELKKWYAQIYCKLKETVIKTTVTFKRCCLKKLSNQEKQIARVWTGSFKKMESSFYTLYEMLTTGGTEEIDKCAKKDLDMLFLTFNNQIINNYQYNEGIIKDLHCFNYSKVKFCIDLKASYLTAKGNADLLLDSFNKKIEKIRDKYIDTSFMFN